MDFAREVAARTLWMEARGEGDDGLRAVAHVLVNRLRAGRWGATLATVCLWAYQFSCWNTGDQNRLAMAKLADDDAVLEKCRKIIDDAMTGASVDPTLGATFYVATYLRPPNWTVGATLTATIGRHAFYSNVK